MNMMQIQYLLDAVKFHSIHKTAEKYSISPKVPVKQFGCWNRSWILC